MYCKLSFNNDIKVDSVINSGWVFTPILVNPNYSTEFRGYYQSSKNFYGYDNEIIDMFSPNENVLEIISKIYEDKNVWMTSGSFMYHDGRKGFANPPKNFTNIRNQVFTLSHLRTWKSWLWKKIKVEDLKDENGKYWSVAGDLSFMFPMLEMSGEKHFKYIPNILYIYNESNPLNDHKVNLQEVGKIVNKIRNKIDYKKIDD